MPHSDIRYTLSEAMAAKRGQRTLTAEERAKIFKALADPSRVAIVDMVAAQGPMSGTELSERLGISLALLCHHWDVLIEAGLVHKERVGQARYCTVDLSKLQVATTGWKVRPKASASASAKRAVKRRRSAPAGRG